MKIRLQNEQQINLLNKRKAAADQATLAARMTEETARREQVAFGDVLNSLLIAGGVKDGQPLNNVSWGKDDDGFFIDTGAQSAPPLPRADGVNPNG